MDSLPSRPCPKRLGGTSCVAGSKVGILAHVFLSYVHENNSQVDRLKADLENAGVETWIDRYQIVPGKLWKREIRKAIRDGAFFIACFSGEFKSRSYTPMHSELYIAIEELQNRAFEQDWFIPLKLTPCEIPDINVGAGRSLSDIQCLPMYPDWDASVQRLIQSLSGVSLVPPDQSRSPIGGSLVLPDQKPPASRAASIHSPGGPVAANATPYVKREHDKLILETIGRLSFTMLVRGPSQCGKTTVLSLLERTALAAGIETARFDPQPPRSDASPVKYDTDTNADDADSALAASELLQAAWGLKRPRRGPINTIPKLFNWMLEELAPTASKPRLLILDDLATLGKAAAERWLSLFVRGMANQHATHGVNISVAVGLTHHFGASFERRLMQISSVVHWWPILELEWFSLEEVVELLNDLRSTGSTDLNHESDARELFVMFKGQPYLTHVAAVDKIFRDRVRQWIMKPSPDHARAIRQFLWYRRHLSAIRLALCGPSYEPDTEALRLIAAFYGACESSPPTSLTDPHHGLFFSMAKLLDQLGKPTVEIYRLIAEDLRAIRA